jgi:two-component system, chemotaxis family, CheB/CheR fusion protein
LRRAVEARVVGRYAPAHVVIDRDGEIVHFSPRTGKYLEAPVGAPSRNLVAAARKGLKVELKSAVREVLDTGQRIERPRVAVDIDDRQQLINLVIEPFRQDDAEPLLLVVFRDVGAPMTAAEQALGPEDQRKRHRGASRARAVRYPRAAADHHRGIRDLDGGVEIGQRGAAVDQRGAAVDQRGAGDRQGGAAVAERGAADGQRAAGPQGRGGQPRHSDLRNIFESTQVGTVFLDEALVIRSFTPAAKAIFSLIASDCGRPLTDIASHVELGDLRRDIERSWKRRAIERRVTRRNDGKAHYLMRMLPYRKESGVIDGVVATFVDVTGLVEAEEHQRVLVRN